MPPTIPPPDVYLHNGAHYRKPTEVEVQRVPPPTNLPKGWKLVVANDGEGWHAIWVHPERYDHAFVETNRVVPVSPPPVPKPTPAAPRAAALSSDGDTIVYQGTDYRKVTTMELHEVGARTPLPPGLPGPTLVMKKVGSVWVGEWISKTIYACIFGELPPAPPASSTTTPVPSRPAVPEPTPTPPQKPTIAVKHVTPGVLQPGTLDEAINEGLPRMPAKTTIWSQEMIDAAGIDVAKIVADDVEKNLGLIEVAPGTWTHNDQEVIVSVTEPLDLLNPDEPEPPGFGPIADIGLAKYRQMTTGERGKHPRISAEHVRLWGLFQGEEEWKATTVTREAFLEMFELTPGEVETRMPTPPAREPATLTTTASRAVPLVPTAVPDTRPAPTLDSIDQARAAAMDRGITLEHLIKVSKPDGVVTQFTLLGSILVSGNAFGIYGKSGLKWGEVERLLNNARGGSILLALPPEMRVVPCVHGEVLPEVLEDRSPFPIIGG